MRRVVIELHHLPCIGYLATIASADQVILERHEHYQKQSYRNRCRIVTSQRVENLSVPVRHGRHVPIGEVRIDYSQPWQNRYWRSLQAAYGSAPFFEHYADSVREILKERFEFLYEYNLFLLQAFLKTLKLPVVFSESQEYIQEYGSDTVDMRDVINVRKPDEIAGYYQPISYGQVFGNNFEPNLSVVDVLFCLGPEARSIIMASAITR